MNRRMIQIEKVKIEKLLIPVGKRIVSLEKEYKQMVTELEVLAADAPEREELVKKTAQKFLDLKNKNAEFTALMQKHNGLTATQQSNRDNIIENGKTISDGKADPVRCRNIPAT
jgi:CHASE3 domain sensor protein